MKQQVILTVGVSGSGKTTFATQFNKKNPHFVNVNRDDLRMDIFELSRLSDYKFTKEREKTVSDEQMRIIDYVLKCGKSVIVSDTNLKKSGWVPFQQIAEKYGAEFSVKYFPVPLETLLKRNIARENSIPEAAIRRQLETFEKEHLPFVDYFLPRPYVAPMIGQTAYIFDVDGTLAHMKGRHPFDWSAVETDEPDYHVITMAQMLHKMGVKIIIMSGRSSECRDATIRWLHKYGVPFDLLLMRESGDYRPDTVIKDELFEHHSLNEYAVMGVFDDRQCVVDMWRKKGLKVFQVERGDF